MRLREGHAPAVGLAPGLGRPSLRALKLIQPDSEIPERGQRMRRGAVRDPARVLAEADVAHEMRTVLDPGPVAADVVQHAFVRRLGVCDAARVIAERVLRLALFGPQLDAVAVHGHELPAAAQAACLGRCRDAHDPAGFDPPVALLGWRRFLRGGETAAPAGFSRVRICRPGCLSARRYSPTPSPASRRGRSPAGSSSRPP